VQGPIEKLSHIDGVRDIAPQKRVKTCRELDKSQTNIARMEGRHHSTNTM
jgi:hypothetical protein